MAWLSATACVCVARRKQRSLDRLASPGRDGLLSELASEAAHPSELGEPARRLAVAELNQRLADVAFQLEVLPATYAALTRISLAGGSALALVSFLVSGDEAGVNRAIKLAVTGVAGLLGAGVVAIIGRAAKFRAKQIREGWDASSREVGKALGTSLAATSGIRESIR